MLRYMIAVKKIDQMLLTLYKELPANVWVCQSSRKIVNISQLVRRCSFDSDVCLLPRCANYLATATLFIGMNCTN